MIDDRALEYVHENGPITRTELVDHLDLRTDVEASDILRRLRYRGDVEYKFYEGYDASL